MEIKTGKATSKLRVPLIKKELNARGSVDGPEQEKFGKVETARGVRWVEMVAETGVYGVGLTQVTVALVVLI